MRQQWGIDVKKNDKYNPYEDGRLHYTQPVNNPEPVDDREGINDVMKHYDTINGHQIPKKLDHVPKLFRHFIRVTIILMVLGFLVFQIWNVVSLVISETGGE